MARSLLKNPKSLSENARTSIRDPRAGKVVRKCEKELLGFFGKEVADPVGVLKAIVVSIKLSPS